MKDNLATDMRELAESDGFDRLMLRIGIAIGVGAMTFIAGYLFVDWLLGLLS